jgi:hypothetical protein
VPYVGAGAAFALEVRSSDSLPKKPLPRSLAHSHGAQDAFILSRILSAPATTRASLPLALEAYQAVRQPYGNSLVLNARLALREFQYDGPNAGDMGRVKETIRGIFDESARVGGSGPEADAKKAVGGGWRRCIEGRECGVGLVVCLLDGFFFLF